MRSASEGWCWGWGQVGTSLNTTRGGIPLLVGASQPRMLRLAAQHADLWNVCYMTIPRSIETMQRAMLKACKAVGRDPRTLKFTYLVSLAYPDLLDWKKEKKRGYLSGSDEEIGAALVEYESRGAAELMFHLTPSTPQAYERLVNTVKLYRSAT